MREEWPADHRVARPTTPTVIVAVVVAAAFFAIPTGVGKSAAQVSQVTP